MRTDSVGDAAAKLVQSVEAPKAAANEYQARLVRRTLDIEKQIAAQLAAQIEGLGANLDIKA